jgi:hypothetical protein
MASYFAASVARPAGEGPSSARSTRILPFAMPTPPRQEKCIGALRLTRLEFGDKAHIRGSWDYEMPDALTGCLVTRSPYELACVNDGCNRRVYREVAELRLRLPVAMMTV